jgi:group I intron endonuclease
MKISAIYKIQSIKKPERIYIGSAVLFAQRKRQHLHLLRKGNHHSRKLQNHYNKYGEADLVFKIITGCPKEQLIAMEQFYIDALNPWFNATPIAGSTLGLKMSEESRKRIGKAAKGRVAWNKGKKMSLEYREKLSKIHTGVKRNPFTEEHKHNLSLSQKGKTNKGKTPWNKGKKTGPQTEETKQKRSRALKGRKLGPYPPERGQKIREAWERKRLQKAMVKE